MLEPLGPRIAALRARLGWTQQELADRIAVSRTAISHFEMDLAVPSERTIVLLASVFKCEPHDLVANTYYPPAKADRLPLVAPHYTEVEHQLALLAHDQAWLVQLALIPNMNQLIQATRTQWRTRLMALHDQALDPAERRMLRTACEELAQEERFNRQDTKNFKRS